MKGFDLYSLTKNKRYELLTCQLEVCPSLCTCIDIPAKERIIVNCSDKGLTDFPEHMPWGYWDNNKIELHIANNKITEIPDRDYISRLISVDAKGNSIQHISPTTIMDLEAELNIQDQRLDFLREDFARKDPNLITFGDTAVSCSCQNLWIGDWIRNNKAYNRLWCLTDSRGKIRAEDVTAQSLECTVNVISLYPIIIPLCGLVAMLILLSLLQYCFRYEMFLLYRKCITREKKDGLIDVFVSVADNDDETLTVVLKYIRPALEAENYSVKVPWSDIRNEEERDMQVTDLVSQCRNYVVMLTPQYGKDYNSKFEFDIMWEKFKADASRKIILINDGYEIPRDRYGKIIRALQRVHKELNYKERHTRLVARLIRCLGEPEHGKVINPLTTTVRRRPARQIATSQIEDVDEVIYAA
ncbi:uncharacterized protein LOC127873781 [Dreissena polymorpha]|nr:uncharacterized protein LOC127873781 [Dreissena polymorpha]